MLKNIFLFINIKINLGLRGFGVLGSSVGEIVTVKKWDKKDPGYFELIGYNHPNPDRKYTYNGKDFAIPEKLEKELTNINTKKQCI